MNNEQIAKLLEQNTQAINSYKRNQMSESIELMKATREALKPERQAKKARNAINSAKMLEQNGIDFESKNGGIHLTVKSPFGAIDFWPSTGKFIARSHTKHLRGVRLLIKVARGDYTFEQFKSLQGER